MKQFPRVLTGIILLIGLFSLTAAAEDGYLLRFPDIYEDTVVFVWGEDAWSASADGGVATRLTHHEGEERFPKFSPDGKMIAFSGDYDGNRDVYVMNRHGGNITRVTWHPGADTVIGWHPVKNKIIFSSGRKSFSRFTRLFLVSPDGSGLEEIPIHEAANGSYSPNGLKIAYNRNSREFRTWKRYVGGTAQNIYTYDTASKKDKVITTFKGTDRLPMWIGDKIYFSSDRDRVLNLWSYNTATGKEEQLTFHKDYDVRRPSHGSGKIVYEKGGELWVFNTKSKKTKKADIKIMGDSAEVRPYYKNVDRLITDYELSPTGKRVLVTARGEVFTVPVKNGPTRNLTSDCGAREKDAVWSPDGKMIAYFSDKSGEYEIYIGDPMGKKPPKKLTAHKNGYRHTLRFSPDNKKLAYTDQTLTLYYIDVATGKKVKADRAKFEHIDVSQDLKPIYDFAWSPDSRYLSYTKMTKEEVYNIFIYSLDTGRVHNVSEGIFNDFNPIFSNNGEHLFFISNRRFSPTLGDFEWEMVYKDMAGIYAITLKKEGKQLLGLENDEETVAKKEKSDKKKKVKVRIDFDGLSKRIETLPLSRGNYRKLAINDSRLFYTNGKKGDYNRFEFRTLGPQDLYAFSIKDRKESKILNGINGYNLSTDGKKIVYKKGNKLGVIASSASNAKDKFVNLSDLKIWLEPLREWQQIFNEAWRLERDYYYQKNMHGLDWKMMKEKYSKLIPFASCRQDIRFIIGELIGELNTSHTYVFGGDRHRRAERASIGMLGVDWTIDSKSKIYRIGKIFKTPDWSRDIIPPLTLPGIHVKKGDYLLAVNGKPVTADKNVYSYFEGLSGKYVTIKVNSKPTLIGSSEYAVKPLGNEVRLRYLDWVEGNRLKVNEESNGQIGYMHFPDTYIGTAVEFPKYYFSQTRKKGLVIDGRFNGGGLDPDIFLRRMYRSVNSFWTRRYSHDQYTPRLANRAHMACLTNYRAGSGGDSLPFQFQKNEMGPVIGTRTWGGLVGVSMFITMIDGGGLSVPDYRIYDENGNWVVENTGVTPDIVIDLTPEEVFRGYDAQLMTGVKYLMIKIQEKPKNWPKHEPFPIDK